MNSIFNSRFNFENITEWLFCLTFLFLPLNLFINNLLFTSFIILFGLIKIFQKKFIITEKITPNLKDIIIISSPFLLVVAGLFYSKEPFSFSFVERLAPIFLMSYYIFIDSEFFKRIIKRVFVFFLIGCLFFSISNWTFALVSIFSNSLPLSSLLTVDYASYNLTQFLDIHPPYAGLFINAAIGFCVYSLHDIKNKVPKWFLSLSIVILTLFLFNLMARNAIFCFLLFSLIYLVKFRKYIFLFSFLGIIGLIVGGIYSMDENYLRDRFFKSLNLFEQETIFSKKDTRFDRLSASYEVFKQHPIIGPGTGADDKLRREQYFINRDVEAFNKNYNAHNQFMEYLSTYGVLGGIVFLLIFYTFLKESIKKNSFFLIFIFSCFFIASISESLLERSWGVSFYILLFVSIWSFESKAINLNNQNG